ncbi:MAG: LCP family protein [Actinomycetota bacterium]|nr:LCP family protein [Actinomycetota bacterium]
MAAVSALVLLLTGAAWRTLDTLTSNLATTEALSGSGAKDGATDILLVGMDTRVDAQGKPLTPQEQQMLRAGDVASTNTDTIILIRIPNNGRSATAISIPRDSWVKGPEGMTKINGVYGEAKDAANQRLVGAKTDPAAAERQSTEAGRTALVNTVQDLTGLTVDHYAEIGLLGFVLMTDAVGGVQVCLKAPAQDSFSGADFPAGEQTLSGPDALSFVRQRHGLPRGDLDRIVRQQAFMASLARKVLTAGTLANPGKVSDLSTALQRSVVIDSGWNIVGFATQLQGLAGGAVHFETIPVANPDASNDAGQSIVALDPAVVHQFIASLVQPAAPSATPPPPSGPNPATITVNVSNATTTGGLAAQVSGALTKAGYAPGAVSTSPTGKQQDSVVMAARADDPGAAKVAKELGALPVRADSSVASGTVDVVIGSSYAGPGSSNGASTTASSTPAASTPAAPPITAGDGVPCIN